MFGAILGFLQQLKNKIVGWNDLTYGGTFGTSTSSDVFSTVREVVSGSGYFCVTASKRGDGVANYNITLDGVVVCSDVQLIADETAGAIMPVWIRYNSSYKVEHRKWSGTTGAVFTTVLEAAE